MWVPLTVQSHFSLRRGLPKPEQIAARIKELGYPGCGLTDRGVVSGVPPFIKQCEKKGLKAVAGSRFHVPLGKATDHDSSNRETSILTVLVKNQNGWKSLMRASSASFMPEVFFHRQRLDLDAIASYAHGDFIVLSGQLGSELGNCIFEEPRLAYLAKSVDEAKGLAKRDWHKHVFSCIERHQKLFGEENFYVQIELMDSEATPAQHVVAEGLRWAAKKLGVKTVATADSHYCRRQDSVDQRVLLCVDMSATLANVKEKLAGHEDSSLRCFFRSNSYHIPSEDEVRGLHTDQEVEASVEIFERCESISVGEKPRLPKVNPVDGKSPDTQLRELCVDGWTRKIAKKRDKAPYAERVKHELAVLEEAELAPYFLIVHDYCGFAKKNKIRMGKGRGSAAGCLVSYLIDITKIDPIQYGLIFERFYDASRKGSLPDIDTDFATAGREAVINYIREKYGHDHVAQMCTFQRMQGCGALKDVLRVHNSCSFTEMNEITEHIPDEAEINDQLQEMLESTGEASIIRWALLHNGEKLKKWCHIAENGSLDGPLALEFGQAIRLEGTKRGMGRHASGLIISSEVLADVCPMIYDKSTEEMIIGVDYRDGEAMGLVKFDLLGVNILDKIDDAVSIIRTGDALRV